MGESDGCPPPSVEDSSERVGCSAPVDVVGQSIPSSTGASGSEAAGSCENSEGGCQVAVVEVKQVPRCRSAQKVLSESDADGVFPVKPKKTRRRRGQRGRWKPYHRLTTEEKIAKDEREERNAVKKRERLFCHGKPMAPYNTTQFLLEDREKRIVADADVDSTICSSLAHHSLSTTTLEPQSLSPVNGSRRRGVSYSDPGANTSESGIVSDEEVDMLEKEFEIDYDNANLLRIDKMSREQVIREMVYLERNTGKLADEVIQLRSENGRLKELLQKHNIEFTHALAKMAKRRKNGDECIAGDVDGVAVV